MKKHTYIDATQEAGKFFYQNHQEGSVVMLNLLKFKVIADYSHAPHLAPDSEISGAKAYQFYSKYTLPFLKEAGSEVLFFGKCNSFLIGPTEEKWDAMLLVKHESATKFIAFAQHEGYLKIAGHRKAALEDSRLLPIVEGNLV